MASEIIYADVKFKNAPPPAEATAHPVKSTPQKPNRWLPWLIAALLLLLAVSLLIALVVTHVGLGTSQSCEEYKLVRKYVKKRNCVEEETEGKGQVWTCCPSGWETFQASCYYFSNDTMTWDDSERNCTGMGSHLVVITTGAEQDFILTQINGTVTDLKGRNYCIGLIDRNKKGQWSWVDQTPYNDTAVFWRPGEPSKHDNENCAVMHVSGEQNTNGNRNWNNVPCFNTFHRICETAALRF
ncbi:C-type lectin domain family 4 member D-like [Pelodiscus sinensis]|uniref:C-type lectin domain family 4 member D-like n=1 Tax=Pelodiscus sinensis TaxID=13735 RepID=K7FI00_PELSI|nr:C-type lectin domain family 4 member D-like [Pelodiscus sinensis]|eukprot:XP_006116722.1 C-type lectin domain family 4 member D-like [Pelodiscus sinensis]